MTIQNVSNDRRSQQRHQVKNGALAFNAKKCGQIIDISLEGLSFEYIDAGSCRTPWRHDTTNAPADTLDIMFGDYNFALNGIPVKVVSDYQITVQYPYRAETMRRRRCVKFGELSPEQIFRLKRFILINRYGMVPISADKDEGPSLLAAAR